MNDKVKGILFTLLGGICWGVSGSIGQYLFDYEGMDSRWLVPIRLGLAGIILLSYSFVKSGKQVLAPWKNRQECIELIVYGLFGVSMCQFFYFTTIMLSTAGVATILQDLSPIFILMFTCFMARRGPRPLEILSIVLALLGVALITTHGDFAGLLGGASTGSAEVAAAISGADAAKSAGSAVSPAALLMGVICAFTVMIYNVAPRRLMQKYSVLMLQGWAFLMGGIFFFFVFHVWTWHYVPSVLGLLGIAGVVLIGNVMAFPFYMTGVRLIGADKAILFGFSEPISAAIIGTLFLGSPFTFWDGLGFALVFAMMVLTSKTAKAEE